jgi:hypothetical protein
MSLLWIDGFDRYGTSVGSAPDPTGILGRKYTSILSENQTVIRAGRFGGYALTLNTASAPGLRSGALTTDDTIVIGFAVTFTSMVNDDKIFLALLDGTTVGVTLSILNTGDIRIRCGGTLLKDTVGLGLAVNTWYYFELKVQCATTVGTYELRVGEANVCSGTGTTKAGSNSYHDRFLFDTIYGMYAISIDDLYVLDSSGTDNTDFLGNMRVVTIQPNAAGDSTDFTPDSGDNYARVQEVTCDDDTSYVESATVNNADLYNCADLAGIVLGIKGLQICTDCRETDATTFTLKTICKSGANTSEDAGQIIGTTDFTVKRRIMETDPNTTNAWTQANINDAQFGVKVG